MTLLPKAGMYPYTRECTRYVGWTRRQDGEAVVNGREVWLSLSFEKKSSLVVFGCVWYRLEPECITKEEGVVVTRREQRGDGPGTTTRRTQAGPWTLVRTDGSAWRPASLKEEERRRQIRESGRSFSTDEFFLTVCVLSMCRWGAPICNTVLQIGAPVQMVASHDLLHG